MILPVTILLVTFFLFGPCWSSALPHERDAKFFYVSSTTVSSVLKTSTLCITKQGCSAQAPFDMPGVPGSVGASSKMCASGCGCAAVTGVTCTFPPTNPALIQAAQNVPIACTFPGVAPPAAVGGAAVAPLPTACPPGCVVGAMGPVPDPCNSCRVTDTMADMMIATCPGRKKKRAILESALLSDGGAIQESAFLADGLEISPSPASSVTDIESSMDSSFTSDRAAKNLFYWITTTLRSTNIEVTRTAMLGVSCTPIGFTYEMCPMMMGK